MNKIKIVKNVNELPKEFEEFKEFLNDKKETPKIIEGEDFTIIIFRDITEKLDFRAYFLILTKDSILTNYKEEFRDINELFLKILEKLENKIEELQKEFEKILLLKENISQISLFKLFDMLNYVDLINEVLNSNLKVLERLLNKKIIKKSILEEFKQLLNESNFLDQKLENLIQIYSIYFNLKNSKILDKISIIAFLFVIPSTIFSMYGMNFKYIPLYNHPYGFIIVSITAFLIVFILYKMLIKKID